jgi:hypothetical protein
MLCSKKMVRFATFLHYINNLEVKRLAIAATPYRIKKEIEGGNKKGEKGEEKVLTGAGGDDKIIERQKAARKKEKKA